MKGFYTHTYLVSLRLTRFLPYKLVKLAFWEVGKKRMILDSWFNGYLKIRLLFWWGFQNQEDFVSIDDMSFLHSGFATERDICTVSFRFAKPIFLKFTVSSHSVLNDTEQELYRNLVRLKFSPLRSSINLIGEDQIKNV